MLRLLRLDSILTASKIWGDMMPESSISFAVISIKDLRAFEPMCKLHMVLITFRIKLPEACKIRSVPAIVRCFYSKIILTHFISLHHSGIIKPVGSRRLEIGSTQDNNGLTTARNQDKYGFTSSTSITPWYP